VELDDDVDEELDEELVDELPPLPSGLLTTSLPQAPALAVTSATTNAVAFLWADSDSS